jgi:hypothetical protein
LYRIFEPLVTDYVNSSENVDREDSTHVTQGEAAQSILPSALNQLKGYFDRSSKLLNRSIEKLFFSKSATATQTQIRPHSSPTQKIFNYKKYHYTMLKVPKREFWVGQTLVTQS